MTTKDELTKQLQEKMAAALSIKKSEIAKKIITEATDLSEAVKSIVGSDDLDTVLEFIEKTDMSTLTEVSKATLGSYIKKAASHRIKLANAKHEIDAKDDNLQRAKHNVDDDTREHLSAAQDRLRNERDKVTDKDYKRSDGIRKAIDRLTK